jgi:hypothetical protein
MSTGGSAVNKANKSKKKSSHAATKARIDKQQKKKKQQKKYAPLQVTENTNHTNEVTAILTANKLEINIPKKTLQTMEEMKRHNKKWKGINTECKQSTARGTRIANIYYSDSDYSDCE